MLPFSSIIIICTAGALLISWLAFRPCLKFAKKHNIVDKPDKRKLQDHPVPVFGGATVVLGMLLPLIGIISLLHANQFGYILGAILILWIIGVLDDVYKLSASLRFFLELGLIWVLLWQPLVESNGLMINNLCGLFGRYEISLFTAIPLTMVACVGIINSINLIDGVDGYSSGYGIITNIIFATIFFATNNYPMGIFASVTAAALIPFYMHNVFGQNSKMFIGDGGSLVIGFVMAYDVLAMLDSQSPCHILVNQGIGMVAMTLSILCIPVFDTLRVMFARMFHGESPFMPDKTHLHHLFIDMGFSHAATSSTIIFIQLTVIAIWYISFLCGLGIDGQFYLVIFLGLSICGWYYYMRHCQKVNNTIWQRFCHIGQWTHFEHKGFWLTMQRVIDKL
ncbi:MAG: undecaprenyl/decaprenyl-phosphate alpha-N-acetylglucosaminyl 1-phosphate transferase [Paludibacteraceae bacterium]|nr:undecaprenyl/decaprenyl-phosphate alpha-N-acetylglucosaminyl 1-phosphate transferase [Paludibacteraceae bacterium]